MSVYSEAKDRMEDYECQECYGSGERDGAELGGVLVTKIPYCGTCDGTGFMNGKIPEGFKIP